MADKDDLSLDVDLKDMGLYVRDFPAWLELMLAVQSGCEKIILETKDENSAFWAERILNRLEAFNHGQDNK
jgi:hypothetical protein